MTGPQPGGVIAVAAAAASVYAAELACTMQRLAQAFMPGV